MQDFPWLVHAATAWIVLLLLVDWRRFKYTVWGGLFFAALQLLVDTGAMGLGLYQVEAVWHIMGSSVLFTFGVVFPVGVLFTQTLPDSRRLQAINILVITVLFSTLEYLFLMVSVLKYLHWHHPASILVNFLVNTSGTWVISSLGLHRAGRGLSGGWRI